MLAIHPEFVVDQKARTKSVLVSFTEWQQLMAVVEELDDIRAYDRAKLRKEESVPFEDAVRQIKNKARR